MAPYDLVQMRAAGHAPIYEHAEHGHLRYKLSVGMETIDANRKTNRNVERTFVFFQLCNGSPSCRAATKSSNGTFWVFKALYFPI